MALKFSFTQPEKPAPVDRAALLEAIGRQATDEELQAIGYLFTKPKLRQRAMDHLRKRMNKK
jgi:hypothetical protein